MGIDLVVVLVELQTENLGWIPVLLGFKFKLMHQPKVGVTKYRRAIQNKFAALSVERREKWNRWNIDVELAKALLTLICESTGPISTICKVTAFAVSPSAVLVGWLICNGKPTRPVSIVLLCLGCLVIHNPGLRWFYLCPLCHLHLMSVGPFLLHCHCVLGSLSLSFAVQTRFNHVPVLWLLKIGPMVSPL